MAAAPTSPGHLDLGEWLTFFALAVALATYLSEFRQRVLDRINQLDPDGKIRLENNAGEITDRYWLRRQELGTRLMSVLPAEGAMLLACLALFVERICVHFAWFQTASDVTNISIAFFFAGIVTLGALHVITGIASCRQYCRSFDREISDKDTVESNALPLAMLILAIVMFTIAFIVLTCSCRL